MPVMMPGDFITPEMKAVFRAVEADGGVPVLAGGCVRDALLGIASKDTDIEVFGIAGVAELEYALSALNAHVGYVGRSYGVFNARFPGGTSFDVSLPRTDIATGPGHRGFETIPDGQLGFAAASARRDYTVNAMMADPRTGEILDFHGGLADLKAGILRHVGPSFPEDPLRVLRGVQFAARFGFTMDPATAGLCCRIAARFPELATERVWGELSKLARQGTHISRGLAVLEETGWEIWFPELAAMRGVPQEPAWHPEGDVWTHAGLAADQGARLADEAGLAPEDREVIVLAALLHDCGKPLVTHVRDGRLVSYGHAKAGVAPAREFLRRTGFPRHVADRVVPLVAEHMNCATAPTKPAVRRMARRLQPASLAELVMIVRADCKGRGDPDAEHALAGDWLAMAQDVTVTERPASGILTGHHLIAAGMPPGPAFKTVLAAALDAQDSGMFSDEASALEWLRRHLAAVPERRGNL